MEGLHLQHSQQPLGHFQRCAHRWGSLQRTSELEWNGQGELAQKKKPTRDDLEAFETAFNAACGSISRGELAQADVCLKRAKDLCNAVEDFSEEERKAEILPITVQQVYVLTQMGKIEEAEQLATSIPFAE